MDDERDEKGLSRRDVIRRAAVVGAVAWTVPAISSISTPAFAASPAAGSCPGGSTCGGDFCFGQGICGSGNCVLDECGCAQIVGNESSCFCYCNALCADQTQCPNGQADCPAGQTCVHSCCDSVLGTPVCFDPCPNPGVVQRTQRPQGQGSGLG